MLRYPIGGPRRAASFTPQERSCRHRRIRQLPQSLRSAVAALSEEQLETPYRPDGWTVRQLVHHVADSHMNAYVRVRLGADGRLANHHSLPGDALGRTRRRRAAVVSTSLDLLQSLHCRWARLFASLDEPDWKRGYVHPESGRETLEQAVMLYDWHGRHHTAHVTQLSARVWAGSSASASPR